MTRLVRNSLLLVATAPALGQEAPPKDEPAPGNQDGKAEDGEKKPGRQPTGRPRRPRAPAATMPLTVERAYQRLLRIRKSPMRGPGSLERREKAFKELVEQTLALEDLEKAAGNDLFRLGEIMKEGQEYEKAAEYLGRARGIRPPDTVLLNTLGDSFQRLGNVDAAREALEQSIELDPNQPPVKARLSALMSRDDEP